MPKVGQKIFQRFYKNFDNETFKEELKKHLSSVLYFGSFHLAFKIDLHLNNNQLFLTKTLRKAIMKKSKLRNKLNKERSAKNWASYKPRQTYCSNLLKESKSHHFDDLNVKDVMKPLR